MIFAFLNISLPEVIVILFYILFTIAIGHYGRKTPLGYGGSVLVTLLATPLVGFAIVYYFISRNDVSS